MLLPKLIFSFSSIFALLILSRILSLRRAALLAAPAKNAAQPFEVTKAALVRHRDSQLVVWIVRAFLIHAFLGDSSHGAVWARDKLIGLVILVNVGEIPWRGSIDSWILFRDAPNKLIELLIFFFEVLNCGLVFIYQAIILFMQVCKLGLMELDLLFKL